jgi:4-hydroxy-tetrahydrodipicolinate synthase
MKSKLTKDEVRQRLTGPIPSVKTPFNEDGSIDYEGLHNQIEFQLGAKCRTILLTDGDSHFECMSRQEIAEVTRKVCQQVGDRAMIVAADSFYGTAHSIEFANYARDCDADVLMVLPPNWANSCTPQTMAEHYAVVAEHLPVMIVTNIFIKQGADFGLETIRLALDLSENIVAVKDDMCGAFARRLCLLAHQHCAVFAGGQKVNHVNMWPYGCDGYLSTFMSFRPDIAWKYWHAIEANDIETARGVISDIDIPFFDFLIKTGNWNAAMHGVLELFGICKRWRRKPYYSLNDEEMDGLAKFLHDKDLLDK